MKKIFTPSPMQSGISLINENPLDVVEKLGKYELIYDYNSVPTPIIYDLAYQNPALINVSLDSTNTNQTPKISSGFWSGTLPFSSPQPVTVNSEPQVGVFSKGNVVEVVAFNGNNAVVKNPNYVPAQATATTSWFNIGNPLNMKEFNIPKDYLKKVNDFTPVTTNTGINYGANFKPTFVSTPIKQIPNKIIESNATYYLKKDFEYTSGSHKGNCRTIEERTECENIFDTKILKSGDKIVGDLIETCGIIDKVSMSTKCNQFLSVNTNSQFGDSGHTLVPIEYLTKDTLTNSGVVVSENNDNKNLLMIAGAFVLGYLLFSKND
jgi:hypothetical protein